MPGEVHGGTLICVLERVGSPLFGQSTATAASFITSANRVVILQTRFSFSVHLFAAFARRTQMRHSDCDWISR